MATGRTGGSDDEPFVFDEAWARSGVPEASQRRRTSPPPRPPGAPPWTAAPAGPRDWTPNASPTHRSMHTRAWLPILGVAALAAAVLFGTLILDHSGRSAPPIAGGTGVSTVSPSPSPSDIERQVAGLTRATDVGSCFDLHGSRTTKTAEFVSCTQPHHFQLVGIERATGTNDRFPAKSYWDGPVQRRCIADLEAFSHQPQRRWPPQLDEYEFIPLHEGWASGDRAVYCAGIDHPRTSTSLRNLRPYHGAHPPIRNVPIATPTAQPTGETVTTTTLSGRLGLVQSGTQACLTVSHHGGAPIAIEPFGKYQYIWRVVDGRADQAASGITVGAHPRARDIIRHIGSWVRLTGSYAPPGLVDCGIGREFDFSDVH